MLAKYNKVKDINVYLYNLLKLYKEDIINLSYEAWEEEDIYGEGYSQYTTIHYYLAFSLATLILVDVQKSNINDWKYYECKYDLKKKSECFACLGIDLEKILSIFGLPFEDVACAGIENFGVEYNFQIEPLFDCIEDINCCDSYNYNYYELYPMQIEYSYQIEPDELEFEILSYLVNCGKPKVNMKEEVNIKEVCENLLTGVKDIIIEQEVSDSNKELLDTSNKELLKIDNNCNYLQI